MTPYKPKVKAPNPEEIAKITEILDTHALNTVCEAAACPNRGECYARKSATFMILGDICTRACKFCNVATGKPLPTDPTEPQRLAEAIQKLDLDYVVVTSVDRDDMNDFGASHFARCVETIRRKSSKTRIELLTPDFRANSKALDIIIACNPDKLAHNQETVRRLSKTIRPQSDYDRSLKTLRYYADHTDRPVKSSLMLGLGETQEEITETLHDLLEVGVTQLTLGQYLQPSPAHHPVRHYYPPEFFDEMREIALAMGFSAVASGILIRSSYFAEHLGA
jgi:lipoic acid synthetase